MRTLNCKNRNSDYCSFATQRCYFSGSQKLNELPAKEEINGALPKLNSTAYSVRKYYLVQNSKTSDSSCYYNVRLNFVGYK